MPRRNEGPRLRWLEKRQCFYIVFTEGRSRERSTGTQDRREAEIKLAEFIRARNRNAGPRDPHEILVTDVLADYAEANEDRPEAKRIGCAVVALVPFWDGQSIADVHEESCRRYVKHRGVSNGTARRELGILRTAINCAVQTNRLTRGAHVWLPKPPEPRHTWLTRSEVARLLLAARRTQAREHLSLFILLAGLYRTAKDGDPRLALGQCEPLERHDRFPAHGPGREQEAPGRGPIPR
jgi:hypothetical protein